MPAAEDQPIRQAVSSWFVAIQHTHAWKLRQYFRPRQYFLMYSEADAHRTISGPRGSLPLGQNSIALPFSGIHGNGCSLNTRSLNTRTLQFQ